MSRYSLLLYELGLQLGIPYLDEIPSSTFPFWANHCFLDFQLKSLSSPELSRKLVLEGEYRRLSSQIGGRWGHEKIGVIPFSGGIREFLSVLGSEHSDSLILGTTSSVALYRFEHLLPFMKSERLIKISVSGTPSNIYLAGKKHLTGLVKSFESTYRRDISFGRFLFNHILHTSFDSLEDIPGMILYQNNLMQLYHTNMALLEIQKDREFQIGLNDFSEPTEEKQFSYIGEEATVRRSFLAGGVEIRGSVENSVLFRGVSIQPKTKISNSVIMNNNQIGAGVEIRNSMILPYRKDVMKGVANIAHDSIIGGTSSTAVNIDFPDQIHGGITVLGTSAEIPPRFQIEPGCYVGGKLPTAQFKKTKKIRRGSSIFPDKQVNKRE